MVLLQWITHKRCNQEKNYFIEVLIRPIIYGKENKRQKRKVDMPLSNANATKVQEPAKLKGS